MAAAKKTKLNSIDTGEKTRKPRSSAAKGREKVTVKSERSSSKKTIAKKKAAPPKTKNKPTAEIKDKRQSNKKTVSKKSTLASKSPKKSPEKKGAVAKVIASSKKAAVKKSTSNKKSVSVKKTAIKETSTKKTPVKKTPVKKTAVKKTISKSKPVVSKSASAKKTAKSKSTKISRNSKKQQSRQMIVFPTSTWEADSVISFEATEQLTAPNLTSISGGFVFHGDNIVLANIPGRGWDIIGGRIDLGESPEETFRREASNQIGVNLSHVRMLGAIRIEHLGEKPPNCPYPFPIGYGIQYIGIVEELSPFTGSGESLGRSLISREGFKEHYHDWNEYYEAIFNYACNVYDKWRKKLKI
jgi:8-oxo-dGTP diphosphatase